MPLAKREAVTKATPLSTKDNKHVKLATPELGKVYPNRIQSNRQLATPTPTPLERGRHGLDPLAKPFHPRRPTLLPAAIHTTRRPPSTPAASTPTQRLARGPATPPFPTVPHETSAISSPTTDELDELVAIATRHFNAANSWSEFFDLQRDPKGDWGDVEDIQHPAKDLLTLYKRLGVPVMLSTPQWKQGQKQAALQRGPHKSAKEHVEFLREEYVSMIKKGHWALLPSTVIQAHPDLRLSPLGVVPQRDRRPRTISDYSYFGVNDDTLVLAPQEAMQFGRALQRLLQRIHDANPRYGPVYLSKVDISDGFYRIGLRPDDAIKLAVLFPTRPGEQPLIGIPLTLPMGWKESPPAFCTATETTADLANATLAADHKRLCALPHRLEELAESAPPAEQSNGPQSVPNFQPLTPHGPKLLKPVQYWDVYVDDFLGLVQGGTHRRKIAKRALLHSLDRVFRPLEPLDNPHRQEPASIKKLLKGNATWTTRKIMLGWLIDTVAGTIELPPHRVARLNEILASITPSTKVIATKQWHKVLGELCSMAIALPGARGLFSLLQEAFRHKERDRPRLRLTRDVHHILDDFRALALDIANRPTRIAELVPHYPSVIGACDAAGTGMGGVFFVPTTTGHIHPYVWRQRFPHAITAAVVSFANPQGTITNSDLELCGNVAHHSVIADLADVREHTVWTGSDNTANVYWMRKGSTTTTGPAAHLLRLQAHHQRLHRYVPTHDYVPGTANTMADICSRAWHLSDSQLLTLFHTKFPQTRSWRVCHLDSAMNSKLISSLYRTRSSTALPLKLPGQRMPIGEFGKTFASRQPSTLSSAVRATLSPSSKSSPLAIAMDVYPSATDPCQLLRYRTSSARWARRSRGWGPETHAHPLSTVRSIFESPDNSDTSPSKIPHQREFGLSRSRSSHTCSTKPTPRHTPARQQNARLRT